MSNYPENKCPVCINAYAKACMYQHFRQSEGLFNLASSLNRIHYGYTFVSFEEKCLVQFHILFLLVNCLTSELTCIKKKIKVPLLMSFNTYCQYGDIKPFMVFFFPNLKFSLLQPNSPISSSAARDHHVLFRPLLKSDNDM